ATVAVSSASGTVRSSALVNCAGLYSDRIAAMAGVEPSVRIVPFRGEYYDVGGDSASLVAGSIYPVPDPD
ncbi:MAG: FAD-dependent oxidoreductase, partial [Actinobacteria bacterium]|nr:FAD-dependent oxidoreductase [Actinomycetota bacterium]NIS29231.1 FAD-dependent oxidoreductase [Actinomycetota bacterium]NIU18022.1 FAD-dependent oxidoreductase [Actinomycetota bacterium]NIU64624.1 FAD-dependent oxidoreductase [Actinomycetota bacterium]NIV86298.1 FAD-dependent oxidoreductase [Actinomycetota bacterium]